MNLPAPGQERSTLETPVLMINLDLFEANIQSMADHCRINGKTWRPHSKAHKSPAIARFLLENGASGITCAKLGEAELMAQHGIESILLANQIVTPSKLKTLAQLQRQTEIIAAIDHISVVESMGRAATKEQTIIPVVVEIDIGMDRVGVEPGLPTLDLAKAICAQPGLDFKGIMGYEGHVLDLSPPTDKERACNQALHLLIQSRDLLIQSNIPVEIVSAGGTGSYEISALHDGITELQAGGGIFMDAMYRQTCNVKSLEHALSVLATITSRSDNHVVIDAGFKTLSSHHQPPEVLGRNDLKLRYLSAEHGVFDLMPNEPGPNLGDQIELLVGYSDSTTFLHDFFVAERNGRVEKIWEISGRGLVR